MSMFERIRAENAAKKRATAANRTQADKLRDQERDGRRKWYQGERDSYISSKLDAFVADARADGQDVSYDAGETDTGNPYDRLTAKTGSSRYSFYVLADLERGNVSVLLGRWTERDGDERIPVPGTEELSPASIDAGLEALARHLVGGAV